MVSVHPEVAWAVLTDHDQMAEWMPARRVVLEVPGSPDRDGVGAIRAVHSFGTVIRERITTFDVRTSLPRARISTEISFRTIVPGSQFFVAIAIRVTSARAARAANRRAC
ncbi:hypothetical protein FKW78_22565 [Mycolicibacterium fortuitum]|nr:SRPBCC family protein [Mycolicibacterium fortuitum]NOP98253.1 hypothetical protein [Mycolicibacterium fortuitum]TPW92656.1 hypothetical protein FKW78_22565 [Mycolicibacterium fortuitum]